MKSRDRRAVRLERLVPASHRPPLPEAPGTSRWMDGDKPTNQTTVFRVPKEARDLRPEDLPISRQLERVLRHMGISRLGDLNGRALSDLLRQRNCGRKRLSELQAVLDAAANRRAGFSTEDTGTPGFSAVFKQIDELVSRLTERRRALLLLRFGGDGKGPRTLRALGARYRRTGETVRASVRSSLEKVRRNGGPRLAAMLDDLAAECRKLKTPLTAATIARWVQPANPPQYALDFYVRLIREFRAATCAPPYPSGQLD